MVKQRMPPGLMRRLGAGLQESLADRGGNHCVLALWHVGQGVAHPMHAAALPSRAEHPSDREAQTVVGVGDHQLDALEAAFDQAFQKSRPERLGLRGADAKTTISRRPSAVTATAIIAATETMRPPSRTLR